MDRLSSLIRVKCRNLEHLREEYELKLKQALFQTYPHKFGSERNIRYDIFQKNINLSRSIAIARKAFKKADFYNMVMSDDFKNQPANRRKPVEEDVVEWYGRLLSTIDHLSLATDKKTMDEHIGNLQNILDENCSYYEHKLHELTFEILVEPLVPSDFDMDSKDPFVFESSSDSDAFSETPITTATFHSSVSECEISSLADDTEWYTPMQSETELYATEISELPTKLNDKQKAESWWWNLTRAEQMTYKRKWKKELTSLEPITDEEIFFNLNPIISESDSERENRSTPRFTHSRANTIKEMDANFSLSDFFEGCDDEFDLF